MASTLVVGGSGGIGSAVVRRFAAEGRDVLFTYLKASGTARTLEAECEQLPGAVSSAALDVSDDTAVASVVDECGSDLSTVVFAAASGAGPSFLTARSKHWKWVFDVNAKAFASLYRFSRDRLSSNGGSPIAFTAWGSDAVTPHYSLLGPSKAALNAIVRYAAVDGGPIGIRVNAISAGAVETKALDAFPDGGRAFRDLEKRTPLGRLVTPDDLAGVTWWLAGPESSMITGQVIVVDGGWSLSAFFE